MAQLFWAPISRTELQSLRQWARVFGVLSTMEEDNYCKNPHERCGALLICNTPFLCDARRHCLWVIQVDDSGLDLTIGLNNIVYAKLTKTKAFQRYVILRNFVCLVHLCSGALGCLKHAHAEIPAKVMSILRGASN